MGNLGRSGRMGKIGAHAVAWDLGNPRRMGKYGTVDFPAGVAVRPTLLNEERQEDFDAQGT